jgi:hypothetical protein
MFKKPRPEAPEQRQKRIKRISRQINEFLRATRQDRDPLNSN